MDSQVDETPARVAGPSAPVSISLMGPIVIGYFVFGVFPGREL
jgi:hypothetical protein